MASPHVAGAAALIRNRRGDISSSSVASYLNSAGTVNKLLHEYLTAW